MATMSFGEFSRRVDTAVGDDAMRALRRAAGMAGKDGALAAATADLGADRAMSGFRGGRVPLRAGYDDLDGNTVAINLRPVGVWVLADRGRRRARTYPRKRGVRAVNTPQGPRAWVGPSRGLNTIRDAEREIDQRVGPAIRKQVVVNIKRAGL